ncbi:hypothetical protein AB0D04_06240 [Streptomyces sp. NPDC048483]|uniref:hypothetical protein n=1 Tax=Streptomyces sp. NPDC048483 TaxID=3154927 RepID=UPI003445D5F9
MTQTPSFDTDTDGNNALPGKGAGLKDPRTGRGRTAVVAAAASRVDDAVTAAQAAAPE